MINRDIVVTGQAGNTSNVIKAAKFFCIPLFLLCFLFGCSLPRTSHIDQIGSPANSFSKKITHVGHEGTYAKSNSGGNFLKAGEKFSDCASPSGEEDIENIRRDTGSLLENPQEITKAKDKRDKKLDRDQGLLDVALDDYKASQKFWAEGYLNKATDALDQAYGSILKVRDDNNPEIIQQKEDLRFMISKRVLEVHASRYTTVTGDHKAIPLTMNKYVEREIRSFQGPRRKFFMESYRRSGRYRGEIVKALKKAGLPEELSWLPLIESGFKVRALSRARALGLWQFIPSTGYKFGLNRNMWIDERLDPAKSTAAAISYLNELHHIFGDWSTVLAAYNCGEVTVLRIIRGQKIDYLDNFWDLYEKLPRETASYVPKFLATLHIVKNPKKYGMDLGTPDKPIPYNTVTIDRQVSLKTLADRLGVPFKVLTALNPELRYRVTPDSSYAIKVPQGKGQVLLAEIADIPEWSPPKKSYLCHRVRKGETLSLIA
ncbi:MAG: transglycosylase SLT domain-containing protein, partial [Nitrospiraceae bacterium]|nr:transglycosylase SLT domain-containing protein [Nitrospiraceae bacterium]